MSYEERLTARLRAATKLVDDLDKAVGDHFRPLVKECLAAGDVPGARAVLVRIPDCVNKVFLMDTIRQHTLKGAS